MSMSDETPPRIFPGRRGRRLRVYGAFALAAFGAWSLAARAAVYADGFSDPVQFRVYLWDNAAFFLYLPAAVLLAVVLRLLTANGYLRRGPTLAALYGVAAATAFVSFAGFQIVRPQNIVWTDPMQSKAGSRATFAAEPGQDTVWLPQIVSRARALGLSQERPVLFYLHADWCHSCADFESFVLGSPFLQKDLEPFIKVRLDVTDIHRWQDYLDRKLGVSAVPSVIVGDRAGRIVPRPVVGENVSLRAVQSVLRAALVEE